MSTLQMKAPKPLELTLKPGEKQPLPIEGNYLYLYESQFEIWVQLDTGEFFPLELGKGVEGFADTRFNTVTVWNKSAVETKHTLLYATNCRYIDNSFNVIQRRDGSPASLVPPLIVEESETMTGAAVQLLPYDPNRAEAWLWTDSATADAWWGVADTMGTEEHRRIGQSIDGYTKIKTKSAIFVRAAAGVKIGAQVFKF